MYSGGWCHELLYKPAANGAGKHGVCAFKEQVLFLPTDYYGVAVAAHGVAGRLRGTKVPYLLNLKGAPILPCDGTWAHVAGLVKICRDLHIDTFRLWAGVLLHALTPVLMQTPQQSSLGS